MKKLFALLLALALVLPMALVQPAGAAVEKEPFYALSWTDFDETKYPYLDGLLTTNFTNIGEYAILSLGDAKIQFGSYTDADVTKLANAMKERLEARPAGKRYWHLFGPLRILKLAPENVLFLEHGVEQMEDLTSALLKKMKEIDCPLDGVVIDTECFALGAWYLWGNSGNHSFDWYYKKNKNLYAQIVKNPKYKKLIRPLLEEYGFPFWPADPNNPHESEIFTMCPEKKSRDVDRYNRAYSIWNTVMRVHLNRYANQWLYEPLKTYYPDASCSDYQSHDSKSWEKIAGVGDDGVALSGGNSIRVGTASTYSYYFNHPNATEYADNKQYASYNDGVYEQSPFNSLLYEVNFTRHMYNSTETKQVAPWTASYLYARDGVSRWGSTAYYSELLYHLGMFDPEPFLHYNTKSEVGGEEGWEKTGQTMNAVMAALTEVAGFSDRKPIEMPQYWNAEYVVSGMYANGRNIWRITPNTDEVSLKAFKIKDSDPTFSVKGQTITFPKGKILKDATIPNVGSTGYWVETPANVTPVMTSDADRYAKYPSFLENFDSYANGPLTAEKLNPAYAWEFSGSASIANKALALTGDARLQNVDVPAKITAGDSYAKEQTWEMTFTLPSGLSSNAEIYLLKYAGDSAKNGTDGGIMIKGGKLYFSESRDGIVSYQALTDIKPGTYTVKRVMNFGNSNNFTYDLYLLDSKGKEITNTKNISTPSFTAIQSISFSTKSADKAVAVDNYKLYPSGLATDFELYDAAVGRNLIGEEADEARNRSTAYRMSWLNATGSATTKTVVAAYYEGGNLKSEKAVKTLTMKPGYDGVETGVVEVKAGQSVHVYLKDGTHQDVTYTEPGATESGNKTEPTKENNTNNNATKATTSGSKATTATKDPLTKPTRATKTPTRASRATKATQPGQTLAPGETLAPEETLAPGETLAPDETLAPGETLAPTESTDVPTGETKDNTVLIIVIAAVAVLAVAGGVTFFLLKKKKPAAPTEAPADEPEEIEELNDDPEA